MSQLVRSLLTICRRIGLVAALSMSQAGAQELAASADLIKATQSWMDDAVSGIQAAAQTPLRVEVSVGSLDSRLRLASCARIEPYLPAGTRLWGSTRIGLRCIDGHARWNVFLPVTVRAYGPAWVVRRDVGAGAVLSEADVMQSEVDWAKESSPVLATPEQWAGQVTTRALGTGQVLRHNTVRPAQVFQAGTQVRVTAQGTGFQITTDGQALSAGVVGQLVKVRMENGRIMSGSVLDARTVRLDM